MQFLLEDVRYAVRALGKRPLHAAVIALVLALAVVGLGMAALFATWLPAHRAARIDPLQALRDE